MLFKFIRNTNSRSWRVLVTILACIVVFVTTYSLILPAITVDLESAQEMDGLYLNSVEEEQAAQEYAPEQEAVEITEEIWSEQTDTSAADVSNETAEDEPEVIPEPVADPLPEVQETADTLQPETTIMQTEPDTQAPVAEPETTATSQE